jgi:hypothetical protein
MDFSIGGIATLVNPPNLSFVAFEILIQMRQPFTGWLIFATIKFNNVCQF